MIKIQQHLNRADADDYLNNLAISMWEFLNQTTVNGEYRQNSLIKKLDSIIDETNTEAFRINIANGNAETLQRQKDFFSYLGNNNYRNLYNLIVYDPLRLSNLKTEILAILTEDDLFYEYQGRNKQTSFGEFLITNLFSYTNFRKTSFCSDIMINAGYQSITCPYCNDNRISIIDISNQDDPIITMRAYLDLDHFYSKAQNPFFALSFYNLIPSCHDCNSREKGDLQFTINTHIHPYLRSFNDVYQFKINENFFETDSTDYLKIDYNGPAEDFTARDFRLSQRYQGIHVQTVNNLIKFYRTYENHRNSPHYSEDMKYLLLQNVPLNSYDILKKPQGKMYRDVFKQIDAFNLIPD